MTSSQIWKRIVVGAAPVALVLLALAYGCGSDKPPLANADGFGTTGVLTGPCSVGATHKCHMEFGTPHDGIINCFNGEQTCVDGTWGACGGSGTVTSISHGASHHHGDLKPLAVTASDASASASTCASDPCNPYCLGIDVDAGSLSTDGGFTSTTSLGTVVGFSSFPSAKCGAMAGQSNCNISAGCKVGYPAASDNECSYDYCCAHDAGAADGSTGVCIQWINDASAGSCTIAPGIDYTAGIGCNDGTCGNCQFIPVCNRGTSNATSGKLLIAGYSGNPPSIPNTCSSQGGTPAEQCLVDLSVNPIASGKCFSIDVNKAGQNPSLQPGVVCNSQSEFSNGNRSSIVNPPAPTVTLSGRVATAYGSTSYTPLSEIDSCNNESFVYTQSGSCATYGQQPPPPAALSYSYTASCAVGTRPVWNQFTYSTSVPTQSDVLFTATTAPLLSDGGGGTFSTSVTLANPGKIATDPAVCMLNGSDSGACAKDLYGLLGATNAGNEILQIGVTLTAQTAIPYAYSWSVTYSCIPKE